MNHTTQMLRMTRKLQIIMLCTLLTFGSTKFTQAMWSKPVEAKAPVVETPIETQKAKSDAAIIRKACVELGIPYITTMTATKAALIAIKALVNEKISVNSLEDYYKEFE